MLLPVVSGVRAAWAREAETYAQTMGLIAKVRAYGQVLRRTRYDRVPDLFRLLGRRPGIAFGVGVYETGLMVSGRVDDRLKALASVKTSALIGCPF